MTGRRWRLAAVTALILALSGLSAAPAQALGKVKLVKGCPPVQVAAVDPIVHHNEPEGTGHLHQFYGNQTPAVVGNGTTDADMLGASVPCQDVGDTAGYWSPPLLDAVTGEPVPVQQFTAYYRCASGANTNCPATQEIPAGARIVARGHYNWTCGQKSGARSAPVQTIPDCRGLSGQPGLTTTSHIFFPSCWDGVAPDHSDDATVVGDTEDTPHYAYRVGKVCPAGFPIGVTELKETVQYQFVGDPATVILASDAEAGTDRGQSLHGDYMQDWQPNPSGEGTTLQTFIDRCVAPATQGKNCG